MEASPAVAHRPVLELRSAARSGLVAFGQVGAWVMVATVLAAAVAVWIGLRVPAQVQDELLGARAEALRPAIEELVEIGAYPIPAEDPVALAQLALQVRTHLLGAEVVEVKVWDRRGVLVFSEADAKIAQTFFPPDGVKKAFAGRTTWNVPDPASDLSDTSEDPHVIEFYVPIDVPGLGRSVFEIYERVEPLDNAVNAIRRGVWILLFLGFGTLGLGFSAILVAAGLQAERRRSEVSRLVDQLIDIQETERKRIVGALHDDIAQPLYRVLYGLQSLPDDPTGRAAEVRELTDLVRTVDRRLRGELRLLSTSLLEERTLHDAVEDLAKRFGDETGIDVTVDVERVPLDVSERSVLYQAIREGLMNVRKHAGAGRVWVTVERERGRVRVVVEDDGRGYGGVPGIGLRTTRDRLEALGGDLLVESRDGGGTRFVAWIPWRDR